MTGIAPRHPPTPPDVRFSVSGGWTQRLYLHAARPAGRQPSTASRASCIAFCRDGRDTHPGSHRPRPATAPPLLRRPAPRFVPLPLFFLGAGKDLAARDSGKPLGRVISRSSSFAPWSFGPSLQRRYPPSSLLWPLLTSPSLSRRSPPQVRCCFCPFIPSGSTSHVSDGHGASLRPASLPPVRGLSADSCSYGQRFVPRFLRLGRAACAPRLPPCGSLRLPPSVPVSTLQLTRNSPCWAHWRKPPGLPRTDSSVLRSARRCRSRFSPQRGQRKIAPGFSRGYTDNYLLSPGGA